MGEEQLLTGRRWLCTTAASLCIVSCIVSLFTIAIIGVNRYLYICWHTAYDTVFTRRRIAVAVALIWLAGVALDSPNHLGWSSHWFDTKTQKCLWDRTTAYHYTILFVAVGMLLPFIITIICYWRIFAHIRLAKQRLLRVQLQARPDYDNTVYIVGHKNVPLCFYIITLLFPGRFLYFLYNWKHE